MAKAIDRSKENDFTIATPQGDISHQLEVDISANGSGTLVKVDLSVLTPDGQPASISLAVGSAIRGADIDLIGLCPETLA
jgi:hypothetical protein